MISEDQCRRQINDAWKSFFLCFSFTEKGNTGVCCCRLEGSKKAFQVVGGHRIRISKTQNLICHLPGQGPKLFIFQDSADLNPGRLGRQKTPPGESKLRGATYWPSQDHVQGGQLRKQRAVGRRGPCAARRTKQAPEPRPLTEPALGGRGSRSDRGARRPAGHGEGGGSAAAAAAAELAAPSPHWAPLQTCPSGDRNKVGHKA